MKNYQQWAEYLGTKESRPCGNNTRVRHVTETTSEGNHARINRGVAIKLHATDVVTIWEDGRIVLNSGGYKTPTTKDRINSYSPVRVSQSKGVWSFGYGSLLHLFADGVTLHPDGSVTGAATPDDGDANKALRKRIAAFAKLCASKLPLPLPGAGDCLFCNASRQGEPFGGTDHFLSHFDEGYVVPSLVWKALEFAGYDPQRQIAHSAAFAQNGEKVLPGFANSAVERSVKKYLLRQFKLA